MLLRYSACVLLATALVLLARVTVQAQELQDSPPGLSCRSWLLYDVTRSRVVSEHNAGLRQPVASLTKLMTALLACEELRFDGRYKLSAEEAKIFSTATMRADKMLDLMLVPSNNKVCKVVARLAAGSETAFAAEMNARAARLGLKDTCYVNASGLPGEGQYSTAYDLLTLIRAALNYPDICRAISQPAVELGGKFYPGTLKPLYDRHPGLRGGKTGYTKAAGRCLVLLYKSNGRGYILITLGSKGVKPGFRDAEILLNYFGLYNGEVGQWK